MSGPFSLVLHATRNTRPEHTLPPASGPARKLPVAPQFFVALLEQLLYGQAVELVERGEQGGFEIVRRGAVVVMGATGGFGDDAVDDAQFLQVGSGELEGLGR